MTDYVITNRGEKIDLDLLKIKQQISETKNNESVNQREEVISLRRKRIAREKIRQILEQKNKKEEEKESVTDVVKMGLEKNMQNDIEEVEDTSEIADAQTKQKRKIVRE